MLNVVTTSKYVIKFLFLIIISMNISSCNHKEDNVLKIGTIAGAETELALVGRDVAQKQYGLKVQIIEFNDFNLPNVALQDGSIDANIYQHLPYLQSTIKAYGYNLESIGKTFIYPVAIYSKKYKTIQQLPQHAIIAIPNDPSNESRALLLLEHAGLLKLNYNNAHSAGLSDIISNPKALQIKELDAAQLPRILIDVDAAIINTTFSAEAGLKLDQDSIFIERSDSPYANIIVINKNSTKKQQLQLFVKAMQSDAVKIKAQQLFGDAAISAW